MNKKNVKKKFPNDLYWFFKKEIRPIIKEGTFSYLNWVDYIIKALDLKYGKDYVLKPAEDNNFPPLRYFTSQEVRYDIYKHYKL